MLNRLAARYLLQHSGLQNSHRGGRMINPSRNPVGTSILCYQGDVHSLSTVMIHSLGLAYVPRRVVYDALSIA
ncbi:hypothetical protein C2E23DRAFT_825965 [Lenzites betulinus]|nr:hypothetical protein C2E23DRAFT_825965 [Lenzites betulinus]